MRKKTQQKMYALVLSVILIISMLFSNVALAQDITVWSQTDSSWANHYYGYSDTACTQRATISSGGCGILAYVNAVHYLNDSFIEPTFLADYSVNNGYRVNGVGTSHGLYKAFADAYGDTYGIQYVSSTTSYTTLRNHLLSGGVAIGSAPGHLMAVVDYDSSTGKYLILDSYASSNRFTYPSGYTWQTESVLENNEKTNFSSFELISATNVNPLLMLGEPIDLGTVFYAYIKNTSTNMYIFNVNGNVEGEALDGSDSGIWRFEKQSDGSYKIISILDNGAMDVTDYGNAGGGTNVQMNSSWDTTAQKFYIYAAYGAYYIKPICCDMVLDMDLNEPNNVAVWGAGVDWPAQKFEIIKIDFEGQLPANIGTGFYAQIKNPSTNMYVSNINGNVEGEPLDCDRSRTWRFDRQSDGTYKIISSLDNGAMDVTDYGSAGNSTNIQMNTSWDTTAQKFYIYEAYGAYYIKPICCDLFLDMDQNAPHNLAAWGGGVNWPAQKFEIIKVNVEDVGIHKYVPTVTKEATCTEEGTRTYTCSVCQDSYTETIERTSHQYSDEWTIDVEATNTSEGSKSRHCLNCDGKTDITVIPKLEETISNPFEDVYEWHFFYNPVLWAYNDGIANGKSSTLFAPYDISTRGDVVTFLWRAAGSPEPSSTVCPFVDVPEYAYYYKAILWAVESGVTNGTSATTFEPNAQCTRAQVVTFLWRVAGSEEPESAASTFGDVPDYAYYLNAVLWAVENGITSGTSATTFAPDAACTRGEIVTFLYRHYK